MIHLQCRRVSCNRNINKREHIVMVALEILWCGINRFHAEAEIADKCLATDSFKNGAKALCGICKWDQMSNTPHIHIHKILWKRYF